MQPFLRLQVSSLAAPGRMGNPRLLGEGTYRGFRVLGFRVLGFRVFGLERCLIWDIPSLVDFLLGGCVLEVKNLSEDCVV